MNDIEATWLEYRMRVLPLDAPHVQVVECRRAFYAGAGGVVKMALHFTGQGQQQAAKQMQGLRAECERFTFDVGSGRA
jgi:hypothetical protein